MEPVIAAVVRNSDVYATARTKTPFKPHVFAVTEQVPPAAIAWQSVLVNFSLLLHPPFRNEEELAVGK